MFSLLLLFSCSKDDDASSSGNPTINYTTTADLEQGVCIGQAVPFAIEVRGAATGFAANLFHVIQNNTDTLTTQVFLTSGLDFNFNFYPNSDDLAAGMAELELVLVNQDQSTISEVITMKVEAEFVFRIEDMIPGPSWDLVNNVAVSSEDGADVDVLLTVETEDCGPFCTHYRMSFTSKNGTRFYNIPPLDPSATTVNYYSNETKQQDVIDVVNNVTAVDQLVVFSDFSADVTPTGALNNFPIVVKIRDSEEYAIIDYSFTVGEFIYKKRSESAGE